MLTSLQTFSPHPGGIQHQGHPLAVPQNPGPQGQPGMPPQMHIGVSNPGGPQVSQPGAMIGVPPGLGGPSAHALQHLNPGQAQQQAQFLQQQQMFANNPQLQQQMQQQQIIQHQRQQQAARQALLAQQYNGMQPNNMPNGMNQMTPAQFQVMRGGGPIARPVNLPQHLQQQQAQAQQQAQHSMEQQQAQAQAQHQHQQQLMAQQMALQQQQAQGGNSNQGQPNQMNPQQIQSMQQAQIAAAQQAHQQQQQAAAAAQQNQSQTQAQAQQAQPNSQAQHQQAQQQGQGQPGLQQQQHAAAAVMLQQQQQRQGEKFKGQCLLKLTQFCDHLSNFVGAKQRNDLGYWLDFVDRFFSPKGVLRHSVWIVDEEIPNKQYEITFPALARYFHTHFESGVKNIQMIMEKGTEKEFPNSAHYIESSKSSFVYWFDNGSQLVANGTLKAYFDAEQKIELLEFITSSHEEYVPRNRIIEAARPLHEWQKEWLKVNAPPEGKQSPEMNKKKAKAMKSPPQAPPDIELPASKVMLKMGITPSVFRFLELAEVMGQMNPLFGYSHQNVALTPYAALEQYVATVTANGANNPGAQQANPSAPRTPAMANFLMGTSPAAAHLQLPGSPHVGGSPAQTPGMQLQQSQHGTSSSGPSANTSPNASNKRRRPSAVKTEDENQVNGTHSKAAVKPSPRISGKRQKGNPA